MATVPIALGALSLAGQLMNEADQNALMLEKAKAFGIRSAGIEDFKVAQGKVLTTTLQQIRDNSTYAQMDIDKNQAQAEAQVRVNAATAGVAGGAVDVTLNETEVNAANATLNVTRNAKSAKAQAKQSFVDTQLNAENSKGTLDTSTRDQTANRVLSFATGFASGF